MKRLWVFRHAKADWPDGADDFDRPLNERGFGDARRVGSELHGHRIHFDLVFASSARRVRETLIGVAETFGEISINFDDGLYLATERQLLERVRGASDEASSILLVGHNPGLERLIVDLAADDERGLRNRVAAGFPTAAVAMLEFPVDRWAEVRRGEADFVDLILARELG